MVPEKKWVNKRELKTPHTHIVCVWVVRSEEKKGKGLQTLIHTNQSRFKAKIKNQRNPS